MVAVRGWTCVCVCAILFCAFALPGGVRAQTTEENTQAQNGTQPSTSDNGAGSGRSVLDQSMDILYNMTKSFLGVVQPKQLTSQEWFNVSAIISGGVTGELVKWQNWTSYLVGYAVCAVVGIIFVIAMPIVGCCFCCCRCCGRCGGKKKVYDPKRAKCKRISFCTVLLVLTTISLAGMVCAFVTNDLIHRFLLNTDNQGPVTKISGAISSFDSYIKSTVNDVETRTLGAFDETRLTVVDTINTTASRAVDDVAQMLNASSLIKQAEDLSKEVNDTREDLMDVATYLGQLQTVGSDLTARLDVIRNNLSSICTGNPNPCAGIDNINDYDTDADFTGLNNLSTEAASVAQSLDMSQFVDQAKKTIDDTKAKASQDIETEINQATGQMDSIREEISKRIGDFRKQIQDSTRFTDEVMRPLNETLKPEIKKYYDYVWYGGIGVCSVYLLIIVCYYLGVLFGMCGERPGYDAPCCNKGIGANFLMAGVGFSFLFSWLLMLLVIIFFLVGGSLYTEACRYVDTHEPAKLRFVADALNEQYDLAKLLFNKSDVRLDIVTVLQDCENDKPLYETLKLEHLVNLSSIIDLTQLDQEIDRIGNHSFSLQNVTLINTELRQKIDDFGNAGLDSIDFQSFYNQLGKTGKQLTKVNLTDASVQIRTAAGAIADQQLKDKLLAHAATLEELDRTHVRNMTVNVRNLNNSLNSLEKHKGIKNSTTKLLDGLQAAQDSFNAQGSLLVTNLVTNLTKEVKSTTKTNVDSLIKNVKEDVGKCRPVFDSVYQMTDAVCGTVLNPFNALWFSWGWCLFFFIPSIIFAVKLAGLYRREEEYREEKDFDDANFSMYGGANHADTIPLTSMGHPQHGGGAGYPGVANSGYRDGYHGGRQPYSNGYPQYPEPQSYNDYPAAPTGKSGRPRNY